MKAKIRLQDRFTSKQKADIEAYAKEVAHREDQDNARRFLKIVCVALNNVYGFGHQRLLRLIAEIERISAERDDDPVFWCHIDRDVIEFRALPFQREDYDRLGE